jgi:hypothetical protein
VDTAAAVPLIATAGKLSVGYPLPHVPREACPDLIEWLVQEIHARPNWLVIEGPTDAGKSVLAAQVLNALPLPAKRITPSEVFDPGALGGNFCLLIDPLESGSSLPFHRSNARQSPLSSLLQEVATKHLRRPVVFCTRESSVADSVENFARITRNAERYADRIEFKRVFIDSFTPAEKRKFLDDLAIPNSDSAIRESLLRVMPRLPSSPGMMRVLAELTLNSLREILDCADADPVIDLTQTILEAWFPRAFRDAESMRFLASIAAVQGLQVNLQALKDADDWLSALDEGTFADLLEEQIKRGHLKRNGQHVRLIRFARLAFSNNPQLHSLCGCADGTALRTKYYQRLVAMFDPERMRDDTTTAGRSINDRIDAALALFNAGYLRGSFEQLIAANMGDGRDEPTLAYAVRTADRLFTNAAHGPRINKTVVELVVEAFDPVYNRTCAERIQICRILRSFVGDYDRPGRPNADDLQLHQPLLLLLKTWWSTLSWFGHTGTYDAAVAAEALITSATLLRCEQSTNSKPESVKSDFMEQVVKGIRRGAFRENDHLLIPALVRCVTLLNGEYDVYGWRSTRWRSDVFGDVDETWIDLAIQIRDDAVRKTAPHSATGGMIVDKRRLDFQRPAPSYLDNGAMIRLICARGDTTSMQDVDCKVQFNPNLLYWLGCTLEHAFLRACAIELQRHAVGSESAHAVMINARAAAQYIRELSGS